MYVVYGVASLAGGQEGQSVCLLDRLSIFYSIDYQVVLWRKGPQFLYESSYLFIQLQILFLGEVKNDFLVDFILQHYCLLVLFHFSTVRLLGLPLPDSKLAQTIA